MEKKGTSIVRKSASISILVILGKVLGFIKQAVIAWAFGSNATMDVFVSADSYTSMFGQIMGQTVGPTVLSQYIHLKEGGREEKANRIIQESFLFFSLFSAAVVLINILFSKKICHLIGLSYSADQQSELWFFLVSMLPIILFTSIIGVSSGYLDSHERFLPGRLTTLFFSVTIIVFVFFFKDRLGLRSLLYGFLLGYFLHMILVLILVVPKVGFSISNPLNNPDFRVMMKRFFPLAIGVSVIDLGHLIDKIVASSLEAGSVSALHYGQVVSSDIISAIIVSSVGPVILTSITRSVASKANVDSITTRIQQIISSMTYIVAGITALYFIEGGDLIRLLLQRGSFDSSNTSVVNSIAVCYSIGFVFMANRDVLIRVHYAFQDTKTPMINSISGVVLNIVFSIVLSKTMGIAGIALATSISMLFVFGLSVMTLKKHIHCYITNRKLLFDVLKTAVCFCVTVFAGKYLFLLFENVHFLVRMTVIGLSMCLLFVLIGVILRVSVVFVFLKRVK